MSAPAFPGASGPAGDAATPVGYRAGLLRFDPDAPPAQSARYEADGLLVVARDHPGAPATVRDAGPWPAARARWPELAVQQLPGRLIAPGFLDLHLHYPQLDIIGAPAEGLLPWLERHTFPEEKRYAAPAHAASVATFFIAELLRHGVTTALTFATSHAVAVDALFSAAEPAGLQIISGLCLMDRHAPDGLLNTPSPDGRHGAAEYSLIESERLIQRWHGRGRAGYAITPSFAPSCSEAQLRGAGELAARHPDVWIQSHVAENRDEIRWARELFPRSDSYLGTYADFGLLRRRAVYAHCIHFDDADRARMRETGAAAAVCPTSNLFLGSGFFDFAGAQRCGMAHGLASDVGGGTSFSPFQTMLGAYHAGREGQTKPGLSLSPQHLWWLHTLGAARALGLDRPEPGGRPPCGNLAIGCAADFVVLNPAATPLLARRSARATDLDELLFALIVLGDDRAVERTVTAG